MKNKFLPIIITVVLTGATTFLVMRNYYNNPDRSRNQDHAVPLSGVGFRISANANAYKVTQATNDIDTLQTFALVIDSLLKKSGIASPPHIGMGVVAYTISALDLLGAMDINNLGIPKYKYVRVYLGFNDSTGFKMFVVPVDTGNKDTGTCCGRDLFFDTLQNGSLRINPTPGAGLFVLDLISPCPTTCDTSSHLVTNLFPAQVQCSSCLTK